MLVGAEAEVLDGLAGVLGSTEEQSVGTSRRARSELVNSEALSTSLGNASARGRSESQGGDGQLGNLDNTVVVRDGANDDDGLALVGLASLVGGSRLHDARDRNGSTVDLRHVEAAQNDLVEARVRTAWLEGQIVAL